MVETWILILTLFGETTQSGNAIATQEFTSKQLCENAAARWLNSVPRYKSRNGLEYYDTGARPRADCVRK